MMPLLSGGEQPVHDRKCLGFSETQPISAGSDRADAMRHMEQLMPKPPTFSSFHKGMKKKLTPEGRFLT